MCWDSSFPQLGGERAGPEEPESSASRKADFVYSASKVSLGNQNGREQPDGAAP